eukprot:9476910-Pyramimonas_sp.AAC.1
MPQCSAIARVWGKTPGTMPLTIATGSSPSSGYTATAHAARCNGRIQGLVHEPPGARRNGAWKVRSAIVSGSVSSGLPFPSHRKKTLDTEGHSSALSTNTCTPSSKDGVVWVSTRSAEETTQELSRRSRVCNSLELASI